MVLQCINGVSSNPVEGRITIWQLSNLILTLFGLIFRRIYIYLYIYIYIESMLMAKWTWTSKNILLTWKRFKVSLYVINSQTSFKCCNASSFIFYHWPQHDTIVCVRTIKNGRAYDIKWIVCCSVDKNLTLPWAGQFFEWTIAQQKMLGRQWFH